MVPPRGAPAPAWSPRWLRELLSSATSARCCRNGRPGIPPRCKTDTTDDPSPPRHRDAVFSPPSEQSHRGAAARHPRTPRPSPLKELPPMNAPTIATAASRVDHRHAPGQQRRRPEGDGKFRRTSSRARATSPPRPEDNPATNRIPASSLRRVRASTTRRRGASAESKRDSLDHGSDIAAVVRPPSSLARGLGRPRVQRLAWHRPAQFPNGAVILLGTIAATSTLLWPPLTAQGTAPPSPWRTSASSPRRVWLTATWEELNTKTLKGRR